LLEILATEGIALTADLPKRHSALRQCLGKLSGDQRDLILRRYTSGGSVKKLSQEIGRSTGSISQSLYRIRTTLFDCIEQTLAKESGA
jgi:RNA polymerase sigma-70 factor, ECF subfamily